jgi:GntR family transcriptional regulator of arabinose operon
MESLTVRRLIAAKAQTGQIPRTPVASPKSMIPKYQQVLDALRGEILSGGYRQGEKLPSEMELGKRFGASRITIGRAVRELGDLGLIERRAGSGTYVRAAKSSGLTFGLLIPNLGESEIFEPICRGMADASKGEQHALLWGNASDALPLDKQALRLCQQYIDRNVSGVFFAPLEFTPEDAAVNQRIIAALEKARIPTVLLDRCYLPYPQRSNHDLVGIDNRRAGYIITDHLLKLDCRRLTFLAQAYSASTVDARIAGFQEAVFSHGLPPDSQFVQRFDVKDQPALVKCLRDRRPEAFVCSNDRLAADLMHALLALGLRIPEDIRVVGIDDAGYASLLPSPLTTVHQPCREIGLAAMDVMLARLARPALLPRDVLLPCRLVVRQSSGAAL